MNPTSATTHIALAGVIVALLIVLWLVIKSYGHAQIAREARRNREIRRRTARIERAWQDDALDVAANRPSRRAAIAARRALSAQLADIPTNQIAAAYITKEQ